MKLLRVGAFLMLAGAAAACTKDTAGTVVVLDSLAGLRYMNFVADTTPVDFRIVDVVSYAPAQTAASFRSGGFVNGISTGGATPVYSPVAAGTRHIRVFLNGVTPAVSSTILLDTNFTFAANTNYSFYLYGYAKAANGTPALNALIVQDTAPTLTATQYGLRVLNLAPTLSGNPAGSAATSVDGAVGLTTSGVPVGATSFANLGVGGRSAYVPFAVTTAGQTMRLALTGTGTTTPIVFQSPLPVGAAGTSTAQPVPGTAVAGTVITAVLLPRSVAGSGAPQTTAAAVTTNIDSVTRSNDTVTVWRKITAATATACATPVAAGAAANDILAVTGLTQPEYNGAQAVVSITAGTPNFLFSQKTITLAGGTGAFTVTFGGQTSAILAFNATAAQVETALGAMSSIGAANISVSGAAGGPYSLIFMGSFVNTTAGTMTATGSGGLTATPANAAIGCGSNALQTRDTVTFAGAVATDSFRVTVNGQTTPFMVYNATAASIQTAVLALTSVGTGNATVTGAAGGPYVFTFQGTLNNQNVAFAAAMKAAATGTVATVKNPYVFSGVATPSRFRYRIAGVPVSPATGVPSYKVVTSGTADFASPAVLFMIDILPVRTAP